MGFIVTKVQRIKREKIERKMSAATKRSFTRVFFTASDQSTVDALLGAGKKVHSVLRKLLPSALERVSMNPDEKFSWNELAGSLKGDKPGFIMREDKGSEVQVTFAKLGDVCTPSQIQDKLLASLKFKAGERLAA